MFRDPVEKISNLMLNIHKGAIMRRFILLLSLLLLGCATSFTPIKVNDTRADNLNENDDIKITLGYQGLGIRNAMALIVKVPGFRLD